MFGPSSLKQLLVDFETFQHSTKANSKAAMFLTSSSNNFQHFNQSAYSILDWFVNQVTKKGEGSSAFRLNEEGMRSNNERTIIYPGKVVTGCRQF